MNISQAGGKYNNNNNNNSNRLITGPEKMD